MDNSKNSQFIETLDVIHKTLQSAKYPNNNEKQFQVSCMFARLIGAFEGREDNFSKEQKEIILGCFASALKGNNFIKQ